MRSPLYLLPFVALLSAQQVSAGEGPKCPSNRTETKNHKVGEVVTYAPPKLKEHTVSVQGEDLISIITVRMFGTPCTFVTTEVHKCNGGVWKIQNMNIDYLCSEFPNT